MKKDHFRPVPLFQNEPIEICGLLLLYNNSEDERFFHEFTGTINHS